MEKDEGRTEEGGKIPKCHDANRTMAQILYTRDAQKQKKRGICYAGEVTFVYSHTQKLSLRPSHSKQQTQETQLNEMQYIHSFFLYIYFFLTMNPVILLAPVCDDQVNCIYSLFSYHYNTQGGREQT